MQQNTHTFTFTSMFYFFILRLFLKVTSTNFAKSNHDFTVECVVYDPTIFSFFVLFVLSLSLAIFLFLYSLCVFLLLLDFQRILFFYFFLLVLCNRVHSSSLHHLMSISTAKSGLQRPYDVFGKLHFPYRQ